MKRPLWQTLLLVLLPLGILSAPLVLAAYLMSAVCRSLDANVTRSRLGDWLGPPRSLELLVGYVDAIVYGEVTANEGFTEDACCDQAAIQVQVIDSYLGPLDRGSHLLVAEGDGAGPRARPAALACNGWEDSRWLTVASRVGDRRLWFLFAGQPGEDWQVAFGPYGRLDMESGEVRITTPHPLSLVEARLEAPATREDFLEALQFAVAQRGR